MLKWERVGKGYFKAVNKPITFIIEEYDKYWLLKICDDKAGLFNQDLKFASLNKTRAFAESILDEMIKSSKGETENDK